MEPDSTFLVVVLLLLAGGGVFAAIHYRHLAVKIVAGTLAVLVAMVSGVTAVNVYYGYYSSWSELSADLNNSYSHFSTAQRHVQEAVSVGSGRIQQISLPGRLSHINRTGDIYFPPQYFLPAFAHTRFPVVELLHGSPGSPTQWVLQVDIKAVMDKLINKHLVGPMILVMPAFNNHHDFQECVDAPGKLDDTYISQDVPNDVRSRFRASLVPAEWGIGGYSSGGYCAANLAMRHRAAYGAAGILDGYFRPGDGPAAVALHHNATLEAANNPLATVQGLGRGADPLPAFWLSAGTAAAKYYLGAKKFVAALHGVQQVTLVVEPGAGHNFYAWRPAVPRMLAWMWPHIAPPSLRVHFPVSGPVDNSVVITPKAPPSSSGPSGSSSSAAGPGSRVPSSPRRSGP